MDAANGSRIPEWIELTLDEALDIKAKVSLATGLARPRVTLAIHDRRLAEQGEDDEVIALRLQKDRARDLGETLIRYAEYLGA